MQTTCPTPSHPVSKPHRDIPGAIASVVGAVAISLAVALAAKDVHAHGWAGAALALVLGAAALSAIQSIWDAVDYVRGIEHFKAIPVYDEDDFAEVVQ